MADVTEIILPWPPSNNHYYRSVGRGAIISRKGREYHELVAFAVKQQGIAKLTGKLAVSLACYPPDHLKRDLDNLFKPVLDALQKAGVYDDDFNIDRLSAARFAKKRGGVIVVGIRELNQ